MSIMTVRGPIEASSAGITLSHEHILCDLWKLVRSYDAILDDEELAIEELTNYKNVGGASLVDCTSVGLGRDPRALRRISEATGLNIVMGAGWYREDAYPSIVSDADTNSLANLVVEELTVGAGGTDVRAGIIGEIGTERYSITPAQERVFRACARAQQRTGVSIITHTTHFGELALEQIALLHEEGVQADRIIISHLGDRLQTGALLDIAKQGVFLSIDNIGYEGRGYPLDVVRVNNVAFLIAEGYLDQILLSGDVCLKSHLTAYGGKGYAYVHRKFLPMLRNAGIPEEAIHAMTVTNPARALNVDDEFAGFDPVSENYVYHRHGSDDLRPTRRTPGD